MGAKHYAKRQDKKLLEGLGKITDSAPKAFTEPKVHSYTNRFYPNILRKLPAKYDKSKRKKDQEGEEYIMIDRVYGSLYDDHCYRRMVPHTLANCIRKKIDYEQG
mgnify:CR=1 FL=1